MLYKITNNIYIINFQRIIIKKDNNFKVNFFFFFLTEHQKQHQFFFSLETFTFNKMTTKRVYAQRSMKPSCFSKKADVKKQKIIHTVKGFIPNIIQKCQCFNLYLQNLSTVTNEEFLTTVSTAINEVFSTGELPIDYNHNIKLFQAAAKALDKNFIKHTIYDILEESCISTCSSLLECQSLKQISNCWNETCEKCNKIEFLIFCLPHEENSIDFFCKKCKNIMNPCQKQNITDIITCDFEKFDDEMIDDMKGAFEFLCKLELYSEDFFLNIESAIIRNLQTIENEMDQVRLPERLQSLVDSTNLAIRFASNLLNSNDMIKLKYDVNDEISKYIFEDIDKELPNLIELHQIQDIKTFSDVSTAVNKTSQFIELVNFFFNSFVENVLESSSPSNLFQNLSNISSYLLDLCNILGKYSQKILIQSFRKIVNKDPNQMAITVAVGIDYIFRKQIDFDITNLFFLFKLLESKDIFEVYHSNLLMRRIIHNNDNILLPDLNLNEEIRSYCGDFYTKRFDILINGAEFSRKCFDSFCDEFDVPDAFHAFLISSKLLTVLSTRISEQNEIEKLPSAVRIISAQYFGFLRDNYPNRKYQWCLQMSEVELKCSITNYHIITNTDIDNNLNDVIIVHCNSYCASLILSFNGQNGQTLEQIIRKTNLSENNVESILEILTSKKIDLIYKDSNKYYINYYPKKNKIKVPSLNTIDSSFEEVKNKGYVLDNQIDCLIIKILKDQRLINKNDLFQNLVNEIGNQVTLKKFIDRVENMKKKCFLSENEYETIGYIP